MSIEDRMLKIESRLAELEVMLRLSRERTREFTDVKCSDCGRDTRVPFRVRFPNKPVYCPSCWQKHRAER